MRPLEGGIEHELVTRCQEIDLVQNKHDLGTRRRSKRTDGGVSVSAMKRETESRSESGEELFGVAEMGAVESDNARWGGLCGLEGGDNGSNSESLAGAGGAADVEAGGGVGWMKGGSEQGVNAGVLV